ncbi:MAG: carbohydrate ABC transporter permease [Lachnospiraceae bacterium]|jgi:raffinose/stachyose/melibiose transport system permease protein|nr:carbohydrate ABC transporter permease [Lachnospiraceae bacterium]MCH4029073.1 carbohydrate ABC transporter permease [Lachnospiraceae bacterium]MCH4066929.1 carbohydrate ABC transporter permease [Lachnospiraceae bacterium]MCH4112954.1 carbohydrate ABC transporter permease [Lachnospiraceae bacterium]MCI1352505.1 carbohydrate ABC transporter permease [Lachnospiraceae bacterium]
MSTNRSTQKLQRRALRKKKGASVFQYFLLILGTVVILLPMYLTVVTAFKSPEESARNFFAPPTSLYLDNIISVVNKANFFYYIRNSFVITLFSLLGIILIVPLVSYSLARNLNHIYFKAVYYLFILGAFVPFTILMVPQIKLMSILGMLNNFGLILLYWVYSLSEGTLLTVSFVQSGIPYELEESAYMDGANVFCTYRHIVLPLMRPIISTVVIMDTLWIWNDFQLPLLMLNRSQTMWTLPLFQYNFQSKYTVAYNQAFAAFLLSMVPMLIFYIVCQKQIIGGLTAGAVKG